MRVLIDAHMVGEHETGNETYIIGLVRGLQRLGGADEFLLATAHPGALAEHLPLGGRFQAVPVSPSALRRLGVDLARLARRHRADLVHTTYAGPVRCGCPVVTAIHDVSFRRHPEWFSARDRLVLNAGVWLTARSAAHILTISRFSQGEIRHFYGVPDARLTVTPLAAADWRGAGEPAGDGGVLQRLGVREPFILVVGNVQPRKNITRTLEAFARVRERGPADCQLVIAGQDHHRSAEVRDALARLKLAAVVRLTGYVAEAELAALYRRAAVLCHAALYEGFGLPVLEAMACGTPVVAANAASLPEVAGDAARLVNPLEVGDIAAGLREVLQDAGCRAVLRRRGLARAAAFSWKQTAAATRAVYARVLDHDIA